MRKKKNIIFPEFCSLSAHELVGFAGWLGRMPSRRRLQDVKILRQQFAISFFLVRTPARWKLSLVVAPAWNFRVCRRCVDSSFWMRWKIPHRWHVKTLNVLPWDLIELETSACECSSSSQVQLDSPKKQKSLRTNIKKKFTTHSDTVHIYLAVASSTVAVWTNFFSSSLLSLAHPNSYILVNFKFFTPPNSAECGPKWEAEQKTMKLFIHSFFGYYFT